MGFVIAVAGKGGTGKTTLSALLVRALTERRKGSVLAIDADPNSNLGEILGVGSEESIGSILDEVARDPLAVPPSMSKDAFIEYRINQAIRESEGFDLLTMGRPEGPGCYCYVNNVLRNAVSKLMNDYRFVVIDNEAGLEHFSRRTTRAADALVVISDGTAVGLKAAERIARLVRELEIRTKKNLLLLNRCEGAVPEARLEGIPLEYIGTIPADEEVYSLSLSGGSLRELSAEAPSMRMVRKLGEKIWN